MTPDEGGIQAEAAVQQFGYIRCYRAVMHDCGIAAAVLYGILEDYAQLSARNKRDCTPSQEKLAHLLGVRRATVNDLLGKLRAAGWITTEGGAGRPLRYLLPARKLYEKETAEEQAERKSDISCTEIGQVGCTESVHKQEQDQQEQEASPPLDATRPTPRATKRRTRIPDDWALTPELRTYAEASGIPPAAVDAFAEEFFNYWRGEGALKADWNATFQSRCRDAAWRWHKAGGNARVEVPDPDYAAWLRVVEDRAYFDEHGRFPETKVPRTINRAVAAVGGWERIDPGNGLQRRDFLAAHKTERLRSTT